MSNFVGGKMKNFHFLFFFVPSYLAYPSGSDDGAAAATREAAWNVFGWLKRGDS